MALTCCDQVPDAIVAHVKMVPSETVEYPMYYFTGVDNDGTPLHFTVNDHTQRLVPIPLGDEDLPAWESGVPGAGLRFLPSIKLHSFSALPNLESVAHVDLQSLDFTRLFGRASSPFDESESESSSGSAGYDDQPATPPDPSGTADDIAIINDTSFSTDLDPAARAQLHVLELTDLQYPVQTRGKSPRKRQVAREIRINLENEQEEAERAAGHELYVYESDEDDAATFATSKSSRKRRAATSTSSRKRHAPSNSAASSENDRVHVLDADAFQEAVEAIGLDVDELLGDKVINTPTQEYEELGDDVEPALADVEGEPAESTRPVQRSRDEIVAELHDKLDAAMAAIGAAQTDRDRLKAFLFEKARCPRISQAQHVGSEAQGSVAVDHGWAPSGCAELDELWDSFVKSRQTETQKQDDVWRGPDAPFVQSPGASASHEGLAELHISRTEEHSTQTTVWKGNNRPLSSRADALTSVEDVSMLVKPSGNPTTANLVVRWNYPPKPKNAATYSITADPKNGCMILLAKKLGIERTVDAMTDGIFMFERFFGRVEVPQGLDAHPNSVYQRKYTSRVVTEHAYVSGAIMDMCIAPARVEMGRNNIDAYVESAKDNPQITLLSISSARLISSTDKHIGVEWTSDVGDPERQVKCIVFMINHMQSFFYSDGDPRSSELTDILLDYAGALSGLTTRPGFLHWMKWDNPKRRRNPTKSLDHLLDELEPDEWIRIATRLRHWEIVNDTVVPQERWPQRLKEVADTSYHGACYGSSSPKTPLAQLLSMAASRGNTKRKGQTGVALRVPSEIRVTSENIRPTGRHPKDIASADGRYYCQWEVFGSVCNNSYSSAEDLNTHVVNDHMDTVSSDLVCYWKDCGLKKRYLQQFLRHAIVHTCHRAFKCSHPGCTVAYKTAHELKLHEESHTNPKPPRSSELKDKNHICPICGKGFARKFALQSHLDVHAGLREHVCDICGADFGTKAHLRNHKRNVH